MNGPSPRDLDVALAAACAAGDAAAIAALDRLILEAVRHAVRRMRATPDFVQVVAQDLRTRLLTGERPRIREYEGRASLRRWLTTAAMRTALNARRDGKERLHDSLGSEIRALGGGPEVEVLRARVRGELAASTRAALGRLPPRDRALLRLSVVEGLGVEQLAAMYGVTKSTSGRWLVSARDALRALVRADLRERLDISEGEIASFVHALSGDIEVSIARMLADADG